MSERWQVTLVDRVRPPRFRRRPRTKKRRIVNKWRKRPENWEPGGPLMVPVGVVVILGKHAAHLHSTPAAGLSPYYNEEDPSRPRILEMHTLLWERVKAEVPEFAAKCDLAAPYNFPLA